MAPRHVQGLKRKISTICTLGGIGTRAKLAHKLGLKAGTAIKFWEQGNGASAPEMVPDRHIDPLARIVCETLPVKGSKREALHLLLGPVGAFDSAYSNKPGTSWSSFINDMSTRSDLKISPTGPEKRKKGVYRQDGPRPGETEVIFGDTIRVVFEMKPALRTRHEIILLQQEADHGWNSIPVGAERTDVILKHEGKTAHLPPEDSEPLVIAAPAGRARVVAIASTFGFPDGVRDAVLHNGDISREELNQLAAWLDAETSTQWAIAQQSFFVSPD